MYATKDLIYIDDVFSVKDIDELDRICYATDYAVINNLSMSSKRKGTEGR